MTDMNSPADDSRTGFEINRRRLLQSLGAGAGLSALSGVGNVVAQSGESPQRYNVGVRPGREKAGILSVEQAADSVRKKIDFGSLGTVVNGTFPAEARESLEDNPNIEYVEPDVTDYSLHEETLPWGIDRIAADQLYTVDTIGAADEATVAVLDTGIDSDHPDLQSSTITGKAFGNTCGEDEGTDCCPNKSKTCSGYNGNDCHENWDDDDNHGTHVAGTIAADDDGDGVRGIYPGIDLLAGKVFDGCGNTSASDISDAIKWATDEGADVINMSFGGPGNNTEMKACRYASRRNVVLVAAAGNAGYCTDCVSFPAAYSTVIGVSNMDRIDSLRGDSSSGPEVELAAPGTGVLSTIPPESEDDSNDGYAYFGGTSMASPHVAGVAALVKDLTTLSDNDDIRARLRESAENIGLAADDQGYGLVDALEATNSILNGSTPDRPQLTPDHFEIELDHRWFKFFFEDVSDPVVVAGPATHNGNHPTTVRVRNVTSDSAEVRLQEWDYLNEDHTREDIYVAVFEAASFADLNGAQAETGHVSGVTASWQSVSFQEHFPDGTTPVVIPQCVTYNGNDAVTVRVRNVDNTGFEVRLQEQETKGPHTEEQVDYLAVEQHDTGDSEAARTGDVVDHRGTSVSLDGFDNRPDLLAQIQTFDGADPCNLRMENLSASGFDIHVDEENSASDGIWHTTETVGYVALEQFENEPLTYETGTGTVDQPDAETWHPVSASASKHFKDPVVVMGPPTDNGNHPVTVRARNIGTGPTGSKTFEFQFDEWDYLNDTHGSEKISYGIFESGTGTIGSARVVAGYRVDITDSWETVFFDPEVFSKDAIPIVIAQCTSRGGGDPVTVRLRDVGPNGFDVRLQEEEAQGGHYSERVDYLAIEPVTETGLEAARTGDVVSDTPVIENAFEGFSEPPDFLASMQTTDGGNTATLRATAWDDSGYGVFIDEEQSADDETAHTDENVGYAAFEHSAPGLITREIGTYTTDQPDKSTWHTVFTDRGFNNPIVVMGPPTHNGADPMTIRVRSPGTVFDFQFDEWDYLNGSHATEDVSYGVFEAGVGTIDQAGNASAEAGAIAATEEWHEVPFSFTADFDTTPVVVAQCASAKGNDAVTVRTRNVTTDGFDVRLQEQETKGNHTRERVDYIAAEPVDTANLTVGTTGNTVDHTETSVGLSGFDNSPHVLAQIQTFDGADPCNLRIENVSESGFDVCVDEENSAGDGTRHTTENVGYMVFDS